jgi:hypothetical protein
MGQNVLRVLLLLACTAALHLAAPGAAPAA